jgi:hypothetical protein
MAYNTEISRKNPGAFVFLIDQSSSMSASFGKQPDQSKADGVADAINRLLYNLVIKCTKSEGVRHYFDVGVIGYSGEAVGFVLGGELRSEGMVSICEIARAPVRVEERKKRVPDGAGGLVEETAKQPVWFDPVAQGATPMVDALVFAQGALGSWIALHEDAYPPIVFKITDGAATDGDPVPAAAALRRLATTDGKVLLLNCHISEHDAPPILFPSTEEEVPGDQLARQLFEMSSPLPPGILETAQSEGYVVQSGARGFAFNADLVEMIRFLDIGTRPASLE